MYICIYLYINIISFNIHNISISNVKQFQSNKVNNGAQQKEQIPHNAPTHVLHSYNYKLLNAFEKCKRISKGSAFGNEFESKDGNELYTIGIIDFLTPYNSLRYLHTAGKFIISGGPFGGEISPMPAQYYSRRQIEFIQNIVETSPHEVD